MNTNEPCYGCCVTEKCITDEPKVAKHCPCQECLIKMTCNKPCLDWDIFFKTVISKRIDARYANEF